MASLRARGLGWSLSFALSCAACLAACGGDDSNAEDDGDGSGMPLTSTGSTCPSDDPPTYDNFGRAFLNQYCTHCHSSELSGAARNGAPLDHNFDSLAGVHEVSPLRIDAMAAAGPKAVNTTMPLSGEEPTLEERERLGQWIACGLD